MSAQIIVKVDCTRKMEKKRKFVTVQFREDLTEYNQYSLGGAVGLGIVLC